MLFPLPGQPFSTATKKVHGRAPGQFLSYRGIPHVLLARS